VAYATNEQKLEAIGVEKVEKMLAEMNSWPAGFAPKAPMYLYGVPVDEVQEWLETKKLMAGKPSIFINHLKEAPLAPTLGSTLLYTDGGYRAHKKVGAWAWHAVLPNSKPKSRAHAEFNTTNNRMELMAVTDALETLEIGPPIHIVSDSQYVLKGLQFWTYGWAKYGWKTASGIPVKNQDLWERLIILRNLHKLTYEHVNGHSGHVENELVDKLCGSTMDKLLEAKAIGMAQQGQGLEVDGNDLWLAP